MGAAWPEFVTATGLLLMTENRKLMRTGMHRLLQRNGYDYMGRTPADLDLWLARFE